MRGVSFLCSAVRMRVFNTQRFETTIFRSTRQPKYNFAGLRNIVTPIKKEVVSRINVLVLNAGVNSVKYGLFSIASRPAGHDWLQKDSVLLSSGLTQFSCCVLCTSEYAGTATKWHRDAQPTPSACRFHRPRRGW